MSPVFHKLATRIEAFLDGVPGKTLAARAEAISEGYRDNQASRRVIADDIDAAVYALTRMPATAAAMEAVFDVLGERLPDFSPANVLDAGAGPGTASLVAAEAWPQAGLTLCDSHIELLSLAEHLVDGEGGRVARFVAADIARETSSLPEAELVIASYALTELDDAAHLKTGSRLWALTRGVLIVVEPGRPRDYQRLMRLRHALKGEGAHVIAPCPHQGDCALSGEDWCHFSVRLPRSRMHMRLKGGTLGYEDEKFSYLVLARPEIVPKAAGARILSLPETAKHEIRLKLCQPDGRVETKGIGKRDPTFGRIRRAGWGDSLTDVPG